MAHLDSSKRLLVRVALVSGSTVATLVGAQAVAILDQRIPAPVDEAVAMFAETPLPPTITAIPTIEIVHQAPSIVILRQASGLSNARPANNPPSNRTPNTTVILPPNPQEISAPAPVVVQQQAQAVTRSSR